MKRLKRRKLSQIQAQIKPWKLNGKARRPGGSTGHGLGPIMRFKGLI